MPEAPARGWHSFAPVLPASRSISLITVLAGILLTGNPTLWCVAGFGIFVLLLAPGNVREVISFALGCRNRSLPPVQVE